MIAVLFRLAWTNLRRDRVAQVMTFVLPIGFFSIFALVFGGSGGNGSTPRVHVLVVDESRTETSAGLVRMLSEEDGLLVQAKARPANATPRDSAVTLTRERAEALVRAGEAPVALVLPAGIDTSLLRYDRRGEKALVLTDAADPIAARMVTGLLQRATLRLSRHAAAEFGGAPDTGSVDEMLPARVETRTVVGEKRTSPMIAFYAAGIAVMFLMFSASAAGGALIEETESGTLERVLGSRVGMTGLLAAKWLYITWLGVLQITVMFVWGMLVFRLPLLSHLPGFALMTAATAACVAAFGLVLGTFARTRAQLQGVANLVILSLSAVGGSMFPRFLMSETLQKLSLVGFNAWALDGYRKVFWFELPVAALWPQLLALVLFTVAFLALARQLARRWEVA
ncbi:MAG: ABC transporter permease [Candidatus Eisenbacteria bacterium]|uniref:ABC transporter permease n=1 Tax=Eiseniibacteriota bacterium TaxID=2212470 RepID=A0A933WCC4_UNCEI|nr:ABC transporter permease [Candidatus Eisenbacteria bacterium]